MFSAFCVAYFEELRLRNINFFNNFYVNEPFATKFSNIKRTLNVFTKMTVDSDNEYMYIACGFC